METRLVLAGIGGQGVVFATKVLSQAALARGERVMASENHGMSQRGGSVQSHLKIGGSDSPLIRRGTANWLIAFDRVEAIRNLPFVRAGGHVAVNTPNGLEPSVERRLHELEISLLTIDADAYAKDLGGPGMTNLVVLGFAAAHPAFGLSANDIEAAVRALGPARAVEVNVKALGMGSDVQRMKAG